MEAGLNGEMLAILNMNLIRSLNLPFVCRIILGIIFIYASYDKILDPAGFSKAIHNYHVTPIAVENLAALIIPWLELIIGVFLIFGLFLEGTTSNNVPILKRCTRKMLALIRPRTNFPDSKNPADL